jgi:hypothetical protein
MATNQRSNGFGMNRAVNVSTSMTRVLAMQVLMFHSRASIRPTESTNVCGIVIISAIFDSTLDQYNIYKALNGLGPNYTAHLVVSKIMFLSLLTGS